MRRAQAEEKRRARERAMPLCTLEGDKPLATKLKLSLLAIVFVALLTVGVLATQVSPPESCSLAFIIDGSDGSANGADPCCLATSSWDDVVDAAHSCGAWTIVEAVVILVLVGVHIGIMERDTRGGGYGGLAVWLAKLGTGACAIVATAGGATPALIYLVKLWINTDDLSDSDCGGNEDLGQIEHVSVALTVVHSVVPLTACCLALLPFCIEAHS